MSEWKQHVIGSICVVLVVLTIGFAAEAPVISLILGIPLVCIGIYINKLDKQGKL